MTNKLSALVALIALTTIRHNAERHVPGTLSANFEAEKKIADSLVASGAAAYANAEQAEQTGPDGGEGGGSETGAGTLISPLLATAITERFANAIKADAAPTTAVAKTAAKTTPVKTAGKKK